MHNTILLNGQNANINPENVGSNNEKIQFTYAVNVTPNTTSSIQKIGGYTVSMNHENTQTAAEKVIETATAKG